MKTKVIDARQSDGLGQAIQEAAHVLQGGGLVAFPTETVYGLAAVADIPEAVKRLARIKDRPVDKPFTLHIGRKEDLDQYVPGVKGLNQQLLKKAWPGPLTVVFVLTAAQDKIIHNTLPKNKLQSLYFQGTLGVRFPDHAVAQALLNAVEGSVVAPSANKAGATPPCNADEVIEALAGEIDLVLDAGPTKYQKASTVVQIEGVDLRIVREGVLDQGTIARMRSMGILFVCTGNTCRSPMAEGFCRCEIAKKLGCTVDQLGQRGYKIGSAGVMAFAGAGATSHAVQACREERVDIGNHRARVLTVPLVNEADYIFTMETTHYREVVNLEPSAAGRTAMLSADGEIEDPIGRQAEFYHVCASRIKTGVLQRIGELL